MIRQVERETADALLDVGVSIPLKSFRLPFRKKPVQLRVTMRRPTMNGVIRISREYLKMGVSSEEMWHFDKEEEMQFLAEHGKGVSRMIAHTICRGWLSRHLLVGLTAWLIRNWVEHEYLLAAMTKFVCLMGTDPFIPIIRSAERINPMKPRLSHEKKGS